MHFSATNSYAWKHLLVWTRDHSEPCIRHMASGYLLNFLYTIFQLSNSDNYCCVLGIYDKVLIMYIYNMPRNVH